MNNGICNCSLKNSSDTYTENYNNTVTTSLQVVTSINKNMQLNVQFLKTSFTAHFTVKMVISVASLLFWVTE